MQPATEACIIAFCIIASACAIAIREDFHKGSINKTANDSSIATSTKRIADWLENQEPKGN